MPGANFTYRITDGDGDTSTAPQQIIIRNANSLPTAGTATALVDDEGLPGGIAGGVGDVAGQNVSATGTLPANFGNDGRAAVDPISFSSMNGETAMVGTESVTYAWNAANNTLTATSARGAIFQVVVDGGADNGNGNYTFTLLQPVLHANGENENNADVALTYTVADSNGDSVNGTLTVTINDDTPIAVAQSGTVDESIGMNTNLLLVLDTSGSMGNGAGLQNLNRMQVLKAAVNELFEQYGNQGNVMVRIVSFASNGSANPEGWVPLATAKAIVDRLGANGGTNYDDAINDAMVAFRTDGKLTGANVQNVAYFVSDGEPSPGVGPARQSEWENFVTNNQIKAYALGMGPNVPAGPLGPIAYDGTTASDMAPIIVSDLGQLAQTLVGLASDVSGNLLTNGGYGADGGYIASIEIGGTTYTYNPAGAGSVTGGGTFDPATRTLTVDLGGGARFAINMQSGAYTYTPPTTINADMSIPVGFVVSDNDGDTASNVLTINIRNADTPPIVRDDTVFTNVPAVNGADPITIPKWALLWNDTDADGQPINITSASVLSSLGSVTVGADNITAVEDLVGTMDGGRFTYTGTAGSASDTATVTINRSSIGTTNPTTVNGTGLGEILIGRSGANNTLNGYQGNDVLIGNNGADTLNGGTGADLLVGGAGSNTFRFAAGDSVLTIGGSGTRGTISGFDIIADFKPGTAAGTSDRLSFSNATIAANSTNGNGTNSTLELEAGRVVGSHRIANGIITFDDAPATGSAAQTGVGFASAYELTSWAQVAAAIQYMQGIDFGNAGTTLAFNATIDGERHTFVFIQGTNDGTNNSDVLVDLLGSTATGLSASSGIITVAGSTTADPIVLDLDDNGVSFNAIASGIVFDLDGDGQRDKIAWNSSSDGILAYDLNGNGVIDDGVELFTPWFNGGNFATGSEALASLDSNGDGVIDAKDAAFENLLIWRDLNEDGISDEGELGTLSDHGITSLSASTTAADGEIDGQAIIGEGTFNREDGSAGGYLEVNLDFAPGAGEATDQGDTFVGTAGTDMLIGTEGDDILAAGLGNDTLTGGDGADTFTFSQHGAENVDTITDYVFDEGDAINLDDLLSVFRDESGVQVTQDGSDAVVQIATGNQTWSEVAVLENFSVDQVKILYGNDEHIITPINPDA